MGFHVAFIWMTISFPAFHLRTGSEDRERIDKIRSSGHEPSVSDRPGRCVEIPGRLLTHFVRVRCSIKRVTPRRCVRTD